jgi:hypothetical protein
MEGLRDLAIVVAVGALLWWWWKKHHGACCAACAGTPPPGAGKLRPLEKPPKVPAAVALGCGPFACGR